MSSKRPLSLAPLSFEEVIQDLRQIKPEPKPPKKKAKARKRAREAGA